MKILLLNISDIHVGSKKKPENEDLVLSRFIDDVEEQVKKFIYDDVFVFVGGDLVFEASNESYKKFDENIVKKLSEVLNVDRSHFVFVPGNHDVNQNAVGEVEESYLPIVNAKYDETKFNDLLEKLAQRPILFDKFASYDKYVKSATGNDDLSLTANVYSLDDIWSVHTLNTAILSCGAYKNIDDQGHLGVDTRNLHAKLAEDKHLKKILLMHHPEYFCLDWVKHELRKLYKSDYSLVLSGHTHNQDIYFDTQQNNFNRLLTS